MAKLMIEIYGGLDAKTCEGFLRFISSLASADGQRLCAWLDGQPSGPSGPARRRASRSASPAAKKAKQTPAISGRKNIGLSASAALQSSLESRLRTRLSTDGSTEFALTWKTKATPSGR